MGRKLSLFAALWALVVGEKLVVRLVLVLNFSSSWRGLVGCRVEGAIVVSLVSLADYSATLEAGG